MTCAFGFSRSSWALLVALSACTTGVSGDGFTGSFTGPPVNTSDAPGITTFEDTMGSTMGTDDGAMTMGGSATMGATGMTSGLDTSSGSNPESTGEATTTGEGGCNPACPPDEECIDGGCVPIDDSTTGPPPCNSVPGNYQTCLAAGNVVDTAGCGGATSCITTGDPVIAGVCSNSPCVDACDCPAAPATGNAVVTCDAITNGADNFCYLDCSSGQSCPNGMTCFADLACVWPGEGANGVPYGDCQNNGGSICGLDGLCLSDDVNAPTVSVCTQDCNVLGDCPGSPGGTAPVTCQDVTGDNLPECVIDCTLGACPAGMVCFSGFLCMWG
ncbi:MAG: hypothetical protein K0V04_03820 [Deltaproteobacteria bacterium]|nr:hypothetical protein [Deltaproteobacteria bacterium]